MSLAFMNVLVSKLVAQKYLQEVLVASQYFLLEWSTTTVVSKVKYFFLVSKQPQYYVLPMLFFLTYFIFLPDGTSLGYISGHDNLGADPTLPNASAGLVETCDFLAALAPSRKKHAVEFDKQSTYSVCVSTSASEGRGPYRSGVSLPHIFVYVAWFGCLTTTAVASLFTIWYGVRYVGYL